MTTPAASIVIPVRRQRDDWLEQSVRSALDQTAPAEVVTSTIWLRRRHNMTLMQPAVPSAGKPASVTGRLLHS